MEQAERLTAQIGKALQENQALRNATLLFNVSNSEFHTAVAKAKESSQATLLALTFGRAGGPLLRMLELGRL